MSLGSVLSSPWVKYGALAVAGVGVYLFASKGESAPAAQNTAGMDMLSVLPSLMGGGGGGVGVGGPSEIPTDSLFELFPEFGDVGAPVSNGGGGINMAGMWESFLASDIAYSLGLAAAANPGMNVAYTGDGIVTYRDPNTITSKEIRNFIDAQAKAGVPINSASILSWSEQYGVPLERVGAAYGMTPSQSADWLVRNGQAAAVAAQESRAAAASAALPSAYKQTQQSSMHQNWGSNANYYVSPSGNVASVSAKGGVAISRGYLYDSAGNIVGVRPD